jgi:hypothetical protein
VDFKLFGDFIDRFEAFHRLQCNLSFGFFAKEALKNTIMLQYVQLTT